MILSSGKYVQDYSLFGAVQRVECGTDISDACNKSLHRNGLTPSEVDETRQIVQRWIQIRNEYKRRS